MHIILYVLLTLIAMMHFYFMYLEMFAWTTRGPKVFRSFPKDLFQPTKVLAANQGLYNGFLASGIIWSMLIDSRPWNYYVAIFFCSCVLIAGLYGGLTVSKKIFYVQGVPALITLILLHLL